MKDDLLYVDHMLECIRRSEEYALGGRESFSASTLVQDGVVRNLQVLAESSKRISSDCQQRHPEIPWRQMAGFRDVAVHEYFNLDLEYVWEIVSIDLPSLKGQILALRRDISGAV